MRESNLCCVILRVHLTFTLAGEENSLLATNFGGIIGGMKGGRELFMALFMAVLMRSTGTGKMTVLLFSAEMLLRVWRYLSCSENQIIWEYLQNKLCNLLYLDLMKNY